MMKYFATATLASLMLFCLTACSPTPSETVSVASPRNTPFGSGIFNHPVRINVNDAPLNAVAKKRFPSPAIFDVDDDGKAELVIGDLMGSLGFYENVNTSETGDPVWGSREELKGISGKPIRTSNW